MLSLANHINPPDRMPTVPQDGFVSGDLFFFSPFDPACLEEKRAEASKKSKLGGETLQEEE